VLGLWLTKFGVRVRIIDKVAEPGTTSRALAVQVRTLEFYRQLGMADLIVSGGVKIAGLNFWVKGAKVTRAPLQRIGEGLTPYPFVLVFPQDAHERLLAEQLHALDVQVERRTELIRFNQYDGGVRAVLRRSDGAEEQCDASYLAGCDAAPRPLSVSNSASTFPAALMLGSSIMSRMLRRTGQQQTANCTSIAKHQQSTR
jgi:2-polyprenyl-6-methoxyphenol hydroxylase-like FAD-dependent oxidoreductase